MNFRFAAEPYWLAVLRIGYLAAFFQFGYQYVFSAGTDQVREILDGAAVPENLIMEARPDVEPPLPLLVHALGDSILVLFRTDSLITRWTAVVLPGPNGSLWTDLAKAEMNARHLLLNVKFDKTGASINFRFGREPIKEMRDLHVPGISPQDRKGMQIPHVFPHSWYPDSTPSTVQRVRPEHESDPPYLREFK